MNSFFEYNTNQLKIFLRLLCEKFVLKTPSGSITNNSQLILSELINQYHEYGYSLKVNNQKIYEKICIINIDFVGGIYYTEIYTYNCENITYDKTIDIANEVTFFENIGCFDVDS